MNFSIFCILRISKDEIEKKKRKKIELYSHLLNTYIKLSTNKSAI